MHKFDFAPADANTVSSIVYIISAVASPIFGYVIDRSGRNLSWVFISVAATIGAHSLLAFTMLNPYIGMVSSFFSSLSLFMLIYFFPV